MQDAILGGRRPSYGAGDHFRGRERILWGKEAILGVAPPTAREDPRHPIAARDDPRHPMAAREDLRCPMAAR